MLFKVIALLAFLASLPKSQSSNHYRPPSIAPDLPAGPSPLSPHHSTSCMVLTFLPFLSLLILPPSYVATVLTAQVRLLIITDDTGPCLPPRSPFHLLLCGHWIAAMLGAGLMRRGPKLYY